MENEFEGFIMPRARMLPVFLLLDVSGSMSLDNKMYELNKSVKEMIDTFRQEQAVQAEIFVSIITFGDNAEIVSELKSASEIEYTDLIAWEMHLIWLRALLKIRRNCHRMHTVR